MPHPKSSANAISSTPVQLSSSRQAFQDVDRLVSSAGICAIISQRSRDGTLTFGMFRVFKRQAPNGTLEEDRTSFVPEDLGNAYLEHLKMTLERIAYLQAHPEELPFGRRGSRS